MKIAGTLFLTIVCLVLVPALCFAGPWKPEQTERPRLLWQGDELDDIVSRLDRYPYDTLYNQAKSRAGATPAERPEYYSPSREYGVANIAKAAAFVWAVEGNGAMGEKAAAILEDMAVDFNYEDLAALYKLMDYDIHTAEAMMGYCAAYDMLAGTGYITGERELLIHDRLESLFVNGWKFYLVDLYLLRQTFNINNHFTKLAAAFGTAAITLNDSDHATEWINHAMAWGTTRLYNNCTTAQGSYTEGPSYYVYTEVQTTPFFIYYDRFTSGESGNFDKRHCFLTGNNCWYTTVYIENPLDNPRLLDLANWMVNIRMPNGKCPPLDDSFTIGHFNGLLGSVLGNGVLAWDWLNAPGAPLTTSYCLDLVVDFLCMFDDSIVPEQPDWGPSVVYEDDGYAAFRTGWGEEDTYALFVAESGLARIGGIGHEHADNLSFMLYSQGEIMAMDPGYIKWEEHDKVRFGVDHNIVTIDGSGPAAPNLLGLGGVDAFIVDYDLDQNPQYVVGTTRYKETDWSRIFMFYGEFAVVGDFMKGDAPHAYQFLLHGQGGGDSGGDFEMLDNGARWEINDVAMDLTLTGTGPINRTHYLDWHGYQWAQALQHEVYSGAFNQAFTQAGFTAAVVPDMDDPPEIAIQDLGAGAGGLAITYNGRTDYIISATQGAEIPTNPPVAIDSGTAWIAPDENTALVVGPSLFVDGIEIARQTAGHYMKVQWGDGWIEITPDLADGNNLIVYAPGEIMTATGQGVSRWLKRVDLAIIYLDSPGKVRLTYQ